ncbi:MAG: hypothetical protein ABSF37_05015 [Sedimentisphaerales bacterium]|jgi:hypothetical protein
MATPKEIAQTVHGELEQIEREIREWVRATYGRVIQVSIQLLGSGQFKRRPQACNPYCSKVHEDTGLLEKCDLSDQIMKLLLSHEVDKKGPIAIGYLCHRGLSNIVYPFYDKLVVRDYWYIFIGQFLLLPCCNSTECVNGNNVYDNPCFAAFETEHIRELTNKDIGNGNSEYLKRGFFYTAKSDTELDAVDSLLIPQMLVIKAISAHMFEEFINKVHADWRNRYFAAWAIMHKKPLVKEEGARSILLGPATE